MASLDAMLEKGRELKKLLGETPEILSFLQLMRDTGKPEIIPMQTDILVRAGQAATILNVDKAMIYRYVDNGLLHPYYTPPSSHMKFWMSEVKRIPRRGVAGKEGIGK